jgi:hypothetical protein
MGPTILWILLLTFCIRSNIHYLMVLISENAAEHINYINMYEPINHDWSCEINSECFFV